MSTAATRAAAGNPAALDTVAGDPGTPDALARPLPPRADPGPLTRPRLGRTQGSAPGAAQATAQATAHATAQDPAQDPAPVPAQGLAQDTAPGLAQGSPHGLAAGVVAGPGQHQRPPADEALAAAVGDEKLKMVLGHTRLGTIMASAFAVLLVLALRGGALQTWVLDLWLAVKLCVAGMRIALSLRHARAGHPGGSRWRGLTDFWLLVDGFVWGFAGLLLASWPIPRAALVGAVMVGVSCVATFGLQHSRRSTAAYVAPILTLSAVGLFARGDEFGSLGGTGLLTLLALLLLTATGSERRLAEGLRLRLHAQALTAEKEAALQLAQRESLTKTRFLGHISHELRTPLHGILGVARLLHLEAQDAQLAHRVELIESSGTHLLGLINDLLDVARFESGSFTLRSERFDLSTLLRTLADVYAVRAEEKGLHFSLELSLPAPCWVVGDPARVRQVLHNLLGNAIKFTREGSVALRVHRAGPGPDEHTRFEVEDSGPGIAATDLAAVFEPFRQSGAHQGQAHAGSGLGLFIARDIAKAMAGDLQLHSAVGHGTLAVFTASLPAYQSRSHPTAPAAPAAAGATTGATMGTPPRPQAGAAAGAHRVALDDPAMTTVEQPLRVLIAEDDDVNALIALAYLRHLGVQAERVHDGAQAVRHALRDLDRPDLVLMDCRMPLLDGLAATREIRTQEQALGLPRLPVVALTAHDDEASRDQCLQAGMDGFLGKPYTRDELSRVLCLSPRYEAVTLS